MAATETQADASLCTVALGVAGLLGVGATVFFTRRAAIAAHKAVFVAEKALTDLERPHMFVDVSPMLVIEEHGGQPYAKIRLAFADHGRFPADIVRCSLDVYSASQFERDRASGPNKISFCSVMGPNQVDRNLEIFYDPQSNVSFSSVDEDGLYTFARPIRLNGSQTFFRVEILYAGVTPSYYLTLFVWT